MNETLSAIDWFKVAHVFQALLTPVIGIATVVIGAIALGIQRQQAATNKLQRRLAIFERRMKVFDSTLDFIALVLREARMESLTPLFQLLRNTRERQLLFGTEIGQYIDELYKKGLRLETIDQMNRPEDIPRRTEIVEWFSGQSAVANETFLKYIDFREP